MRRLITCAALLLIASGAAFSLMAREPAGGRILDADVGQVGSLDVAAADDLRSQLLDRLKAKVDLMSEEEIQQALEATEEEIRIRSADYRLRDVIESLSAINDEFEGTPAAGIAQRMMQVYANRGVPTRSAPPEATPVPTY